MTEKPIRLNLGCGLTIMKNWVNCDYEKGIGVNVTLNMNNPLPFDDNSIDEILAAHILEHLPEWYKAVKECHRILKPGGKFTIKVPYGVNGDPFHVRFFYPNSMVYFLPGIQGQDRSLEVNTLPNFELKHRYIWKVLPFQWHINKYLRLNLTKNKHLGKKSEIEWSLRKPNGV